MRTRALLTAMDVPLGRAVGNAVEVAESVAALQGNGPADLMAVTLALARQMLALAGLDADPAAAIADGRALAAYRAMVRAQGGDPDAPLPRAAFTQVLPAPADGWLTGLDALAVGTAAWRLGAGRARKEDYGQRGRGGHLPGQAGRPGAGRPAAARAPRRRTGALRPCPGRPSRTRSPSARTARRRESPRSSNTSPPRSSGHHSSVAQWGDADTCRDPGGPQGPAARSPGRRPAPADRPRAGPRDGLPRPAR